ncbi:ABC transporter ATP-binding protein [Corallincola spongiicola]|uniref:ABC transporter ATP-binding protein n=1 Tax=Corallincola spongiicola TaxID=2520508 RepID=A0ABY1WTV8_9GAMM|nr:ABC transporter ATP-binding protein [Corallincola spongiicola]TAA48165.1 ABC transporter ATP-binding protein [Corallincola spongiicola]
MKDRQPRLLSWQWISNEIRGFKRPLLIANVVAILATALSVPVPLLMPLMVDEVLLNNPGSTLDTLNMLLPTSWQNATVYITLIFVLTVALRISSVLLSVLQSRQFTIISKSLTLKLRQRLLQQIQQISLKGYETIGSGGLSSHLITDVDTIDRFVGETLSKLIISGLTILGTAVILLLIDWRLGLFILLCNPIVIYFSKILGSKVKELKKDENSAIELFQQSLVETLDAIHEIRTANREKHYLKRIAERAGNVKHRAIEFGWKSEAAGKLSFLVFLIGFELFRAVAMLMVVFSDLTVGQIFAVFGYLWFMMTPVNELLGMQVAFYSANGALQRLNKIFTYPTIPEQNGNADPFTKGEPVAINVKGLTFNYEDDREILRGINLDIAAGEKIAIVGASGGGKSTLIQLLLALYPKSSGSISYGGCEISDIAPDALRENIATVLQHPTLFNDSIRNNLCMGEHYSSDACWDALKVAELADFVAEMELNLDTPIGTRGVRLSGGQRQRIAIARMVLRNPAIVILDEATSALDTETEAKVHSNLKSFLQQRTTIVIAHRLSAVKQADTIYVFEDGQICQSGRHHELISAEGVYRTLYGGEDT